MLKFSCGCIYGLDKDSFIFDDSDPWTSYSYNIKLWSKEVREGRLIVSNICDKHLTEAMGELL